MLDIYQVFYYFFLKNPVSQKKPHLCMYSTDRQSQIVNVTIEVNFEKNLKIVTLTGSTNYLKISCTLCTVDLGV
jgi:hypothetical protein